MELRSCLAYAVLRAWEVKSPAVKSSGAAEVGSISLLNFQKTPAGLLCLIQEAIGKCEQGNPQTFVLE